MAPLISEEIIPNSSPPNGGFPKRRVTYELPTNCKFNLDDYLKALDMMAEGFSTLDAANAIGVNRVTLYRWKDRDESALQMWNQAQERFAASLVDNAARAGDRLCSDEVLGIDEPKRANAWVNAKAQGARTMVEVAKRVAPRLYGDRIEHTGQQAQIAFVVSVAPPAGSTASGHLINGPAGKDLDVIEVKPLERSAPRRPGRPGKVKVRQDTPPSKQRGKRKSP